MTFTQLQKLALSFHNTTEEPHFEKTSFRVKKKIFATYDKTNHLAVIKLSEADQDLFRIASNGSIYPVENKWGKQGWTKVDLKKVDRSLFSHALRLSYDTVTKKK